MRALLLFLSERRWIGEALDRLRLTRRLVRRFVAGKSVEEAFAVLERFNAAGSLSAITYLGENARSPEEARAAAAVYGDILGEIKRRNFRCLPSLKLTHLGLDLSDAFCVDTLRPVVEQAQDAGIRVWIDMESTAYTDRTLALYEALRASYPNVACVIQSYLRRSEADIRRLITLGAAVRLCKGAYREPPSLAFVDKRQVDANYAQLMDLLLSPEAMERGVYPAFATHDERLIQRAVERSRALGLSAEQFEIQMLYGIRHDLHAEVEGRGLKLRVLVPFGEEWYGYFVRRLAERPANLLFVLKNLRRGRVDTQ
ncbi:MAG: proline dehydrogenase family protein [Candidatus Methylomirabilia bacterium]